jgi:hypothetical protein
VAFTLHARLAFVTEYGHDALAAPNITYLQDVSPEPAAISAQT